MEKIVFLAIFSSLLIGILIISYVKEKNMFAGMYVVTLIMGVGFYLFQYGQLNTFTIKGLSAEASFKKGEKMLSESKVSTIPKPNTSLSKTHTTSEKKTRSESIPSFISDQEMEINRAGQMVNEGKLDIAYNIAESLIKKNPQFALGYMTLGVIKCKKGKLVEAELDLIKSMYLGLPKDYKSDAFFFFGVINYFQKRYKQSKLYFEQCLQSKPNDNNLKLAEQYLEVLREHLELGQE